MTNGPNEWTNGPNEWTKWSGPNGVDQDPAERYVKGDFIVHLAGLKGVAKCLMFRHYYRGAKQAGVAGVVSLVVHPFTRHDTPFVRVFIPFIYLCIWST